MGQSRGLCVLGRGTGVSRVVKAELGVEGTNIFPFKDREIHSNPWIRGVTEPWTSITSLPLSGLGVPYAKG